MKLSVTILTLFISLVWSLNLNAQAKDSTSKPKVQFCSKNELGGLIGIGRIDDPYDYRMQNPEWGLELTSTNGIQYGSFFAGIGAGVRALGDDFVVPLFLHLSYDLLINRKVKGFFLCADLGSQFVDRQNSFGDKETGNFFAAYGLGYTFPAAKRMNLYLKANIIHQRATAEDTYGGLGPTPYHEQYTLTYSFLRISVGLKFTK